MQSVQHMLLPIRSRQHRFRQFETNEIIVMNQFQSTQIVTDQTNHSYSFNTNTIFYVDSKINKIVFKSKTNRVVFSNQ